MSILKYLTGFFVGVAVCALFALAKIGSVVDHQQVSFQGTSIHPVKHCRT